MENVYVFGHKKPDTDSICSAISAAYLMNQRSQEYNCIPMRLGNINSETEFVLNYFNVKVPKYLNDVKIRIKNTNYRRGLFINHYATLKEAYDKMTKNGVTTIPVVNKDQHLKGLLTLTEIVSIFMDDDYKINTYFDKIVKSLEGTVVNKRDELISGELMLVGSGSTTFRTKINDLKDKIILVADRYTIIEHAIKEGAKMIVLTAGVALKDSHLKLIKENNINCIITPLDTARATHAMRLVNFIKQYLTNREIITINDSDFYVDLPEVTKKYGFSSYPVIGKEGIVLGLLRIVETVESHKRKVILVDHNEKAQSVIGLEEAEIVEVIDHHKLGNIETNKPINFRNMAVGCTCTILYLMYKDYDIEIPYEIKGLLLSAILSDTLILQSPTTTKLDIDIVNHLANSLGLDYNQYGREMFKAGSSIKGLSPSEIILRDYKKFSINDLWIGVGQLFLTDFSELDEIKEEIIAEIDNINKTNEFRSVMLYVTDIIGNDSYVYYSSGSEDIIKKAFDLKEVEQGVFLKGIVSRKKQIIPGIMEALK